jgi:hypothetical protein
VKLAKGNSSNQGRNSQACSFSQNGACTSNTECNPERIGQLLTALANLNAAKGPDLTTYTNNKLNDLMAKQRREAENDQDDDG